MKTIIAGSREILDRDFVFEVVEKSGFTITEVVCGCCVGPDQIGHDWARSKGIPVRFYPAWDSQQKWAIEHAHEGEPILFEGIQGGVAGPIRNGRMVEYADALIAVYIEGSRGTANCITQALGKNPRMKIKAVKYPSPGHVVDGR